MSRADKDGRIAQMLSDRLACLAIDVNESIREGASELAEEYPELFDGPEP